MNIYSSELLYKDIKKNYKKRDKIITETTNLNRKFDLAKDFNLSSFNNWLSETSDLSDYTYKHNIVLNNNKIIIYTKTANLYDSVDKETIDDIVSVVLTLNEFFNREKGQKIVILPTKCKKEFNLIKGEVLGPKNCNSGFTVFDNENTIYLIRLEEIIKVLIHEMLHANECERDFKIKNSRLLFFESYVEFLALSLNIIFYMLKRDIQYSEFKNLIDRECFYSTIKMKQILDYYDIKNTNILLDKGFSQKTAVFEYYIIKTIMLYKYDKFFNLIDNKLKVKKDNINNHVDIYLENIFKILSSPRFNYIINKITNSTITEYLDKYQIPLNSLRMTSITI